MPDQLRDLIQLSLGGTPEQMLEKALEMCIEVSGAAGGSILGEEGPYLQFSYSNAEELIGQRVPFDSIAGDTVRRGIIIYTYAPKDDRHFEGIDTSTNLKTEYLLSIPIPSIHQSTSEESQRRNSGALQLLFSEHILTEVSPDDLPHEMEIEEFRGNSIYEEHFGDVFRLLPNVAFGMEVVNLRHTSYQAIHELKNKLISAHSWLNYLRDDISEHSPDLLEVDAVQEDMDLMQSSITEGAELAKTYLAFTRIYEPDFVCGSINDVLKDTAASAEALGREHSPDRDLAVAVSLDADIPGREIDADKLKMAFFNLCKNAIEALVENQIETPRIDITSKLDDGMITITVKDNGPGMPPEIADNLFIAFKTQKEGGTGLGLTITKKIIDIHDGTIRCDTGADGTSFTISMQGG